MHVTPRRAGALAALVATIGLGGTTSAAVARIAPPLPHFDAPSALAATATSLWVANAANSSLTLLSPTGTVRAVLKGAPLGITTPIALAVAGPHLWVANASSGIVELNATSGALVRKLTAPSDHLIAPRSLVVSSGNLWVADSGANALTELNASSGALIRIVANTATQVRFDDPVAMATPSIPGTLWVASEANGEVTEVSTSTGAVLKTITTPADGLMQPSGIALSGGSVFVADAGGNQLTELSAATGALIQIITNSSLNQNYGFNAPGPMTAWGGFVYVASPPGSSPMVTQLDPGTGNGNWMMCNTNYAFHFSGPSALQVLGQNLFVANASNNTVTEMNATTGVLVQDLS